MCGGILLVQTTCFPGIIFVYVAGSDFIWFPFITALNCKIEILIPWDNDFINSSSCKIPWFGYWWTNDSFFVISFTELPRDCFFDFLYHFIQYNQSFIVANFSTNNCVRVFESINKPIIAEMVIRFMMNDKCVYLNKLY